MKKSLRAIAIGTTIAAAFSAGVFAEDIYQTVSAYLIHDVTVSMDGVELSYINEDGSALPPLVYNDYMNTLWGDPMIQRLRPIAKRAADSGAEVFMVARVLDK